ncbi:MAG: DHH family phosphoesterase [Oscillospiraceae bacterium]|nr:DHH family phosphoesterase [Oscillospiraceae bacterium]
MKKLTRSETAEILLAHNNFSIVTHRRPDGDTIGSSALLCMGLRQLGKNAHILKNPETTPKYLHLHQGLTKSMAEAGDFVVSVDVASDNMLPDCFKALTFDLRIDHHGSATSFTPVELVEPDAAACGETVYGVLQEMGAELDIPMANALYTAISTDTGCFRYANTTADTFAVAAACAKAGAEVFNINQALFETNSLARLKVQAYLLQNAVFLQDGKIAICTLPKAIEQEFGANEDDLDNISGFPRSIEGVKLAVTIREEGERRVKMSVRAVPGQDASALCAKFGGGGHKGAAGASMNMTMDEATKAVIAELPII